MTDAAIETVMGRTSQEEIHLVRFLYADHGGIIRGKAAGTAQLRERMIDGCNREAAGRSVGELERYRDEFLAELLALLERFSLSSHRPGLPEPAYDRESANRLGDTERPLPAYWPG